ncbi:GAF and ANTAR domain-containing protein [Arthrobacter sp. EH-1B-1]|uniref:GAF and ANTAR domain-containing protein n=1 Tax=Arthrobacter vasquezii TaxID=2977629 RepID=A0ABT6CXV3_9MICC|nr:GAF and ANTAR domain-containing protein [Arthrobacter vasquezii]MDF9278858.1 GAF and ANTAR domain-containing protein [Arthrobacter vasquezii]
MSSDLTDSRTNNDLQDAVLNSTDVSQFLDELCRHAVRSLSDGEDGEQVLCGITLLRDRKAATVASSSEHARNMDEIQYSFNDGPCLTAAREQTTVEVPDVRRDERWPEYVEAISEHGMHSILAVPFDLAGDAKAALNLYSDTANQFTDEAVERARAYASEASRSLRLTVRIAQHSENAEDLITAMESRTPIDIAIGIIMCQSRCNQTEAFEFLKKASSHRNIKLRNLAGQIVAGANANTKPATHFDH